MWSKKRLKYHKLWIWQKTSSWKPDQSLMTFCKKIKLLNKLTKGYQRGYYWHVDMMDDLVDLPISLWQVEGAKPKRSASECSAWKRKRGTGRTSATCKVFCCINQEASKNPKACYCWVKNFLGLSFFLICSRLAKMLPIQGSFQSFQPLRITQMSPVAGNAHRDTNCCTLSPPRGNCSVYGYDFNI